MSETKTDDNNTTNTDILKAKPEEHLRKLDDKDIKLTKKINEHYGDKISMLYPGVIRNFITGYKHFEGKNDERFNETVKRIDALLGEYKKYGFDTILNKKINNENKMFEAWPIYCFGYDIQGHPVLYDEIASAKISLINEAFGDVSDANAVEGLKIYRYRFHRRLANCKRIKSDKYNVMILKHCMVMDLQGFTAQHLSAKFRGLVKQIIGSEQNLFPDTLYRCFVINAGWVFRGLWKLVSTFIDPLTVVKIKVLGGQKEYLKEMTKIIPIDQIPTKYGGKSKLNIKLGMVADLPHDRYPLNYYDNNNSNNNNNNNDNNNNINKTEDDNKTNDDIKDNNDDTTINDTSNKPQE